ncbi:MAG: hypothetical protein ACON5H_09310 [Akkermansiaceae bacterium]
MSLAIFSALILLTLAPIRAEIENEIPWGIETVAGIRSGYVYRGIELADTSLDLQIEAEISLSNDTSLSLGTWHLSESSGNFSESAVFLDLHHELNEQTQIGTSLTSRNFRNSVLESGLDFGVFLNRRINDLWDVKAGAYYDTGNDAFYASTEIRWRKPISEKTFVSIDNGVSFVSNYLDREGFNELYGRLSFTYAISDASAITPFLGWSMQLDDSRATDPVFGGVWFEFIF